MKYTSGKWEVTKWASHNDIHVSVNEGSYMSFVCNCGNPIADSLPTNPDAEANACLIAAAPEMYEALKDLVTKYIINPGTEHEFVSFMEIGVPKEWDIARQAIAKAEGK